MSLNWSRRKTLTGIGAIASVPMSGCSVFDNSQALAHYVNIFNYDDTTHSFSILLEDESGESISQWNIVLESETAEERADKFTGTPETVSITVDSAEPIRRSWPATNCQEEGVKSAGGISLYLTSEEDIHIEPRCDTIYVD
jgi:hypothetical protein